MKLEISATLIATTLIGVMVSVLSFMLKSWMSKVEAAIKEFAKSLRKLEIAEATAKEREANIQGGLSQLTQSIKDTDANMGKLSSSIDKAWIVLQNSKQATPRLSDN